MLVYYPAIVERERDSDVGVSFPDFPGCVTAADTLVAALDLASEALALHIRGLLEDGEALPPARLDDVGFEELARTEGTELRLLTLVPVYIPGRAKRINVTLDEALLAEIDSVTDNRSGFLDQAARALLARRRASASRTRH